MNEIPRILLVDDSIDTQNLVKIALSRNLDCEIYLANSGEEALPIVFEDHPDLILLDVDLPDTDGYSLFKVIHSHEGIEDVPIIFLSGNVSQQDIIMGLKLGAVDYITKPYYPRELIARVQSHLKIYLQKQLIEQHSLRNSELLQVLCHDMANQVSVMSGQLYLSEKRPAEAAWRLQRMKPSVESMTKMISLVRKFRSIDDGKIKIRLIPVDLNQAVENSLDTLDQKLTEKNIITKVLIPENMAVMAEKTSFVNSVISNLLTNAIKFSFPGGEVSISAQNVDDGFVALSIQDHGIGIPPEIIRDLYKMNKSTSRSGTCDESGTGYGMPLVKKFVNLYSGDISVESVVKEEGVKNHGTRFTLTLGKA